MNETTYASWVGRWVTYESTGRPELGNGQRFKVVQDSDTSAGFDAGIYGIQWCSKNSLRLVEDKPEIKASVLDVDDIFTAATGGPREQIVNEIARIKTRLAELETALKVIDSL